MYMDCNVTFIFVASYIHRMIDAPFSRIKKQFKAIKKEHIVLARIIKRVDEFPVIFFFEKNDSLNSSTRRLTEIPGLPLPLYVHIGNREIWDGIQKSVIICHKVISV
jgi:hypothetical protein